MKSMVYGLCVFFLLVDITSVTHAANLDDRWKEAKQNIIVSDQSNSQKDSFEFKFTDRELLEMSKWKDKSFDDLWKDALDCNRAALYMIGMCFLTGSNGLTIDVEQADCWFSRSASFGFGPAIKQILHKNIENKNPFLVMVYSNLLASMEHKEFIVPYHEFRRTTLDNLGVDVFKEIERIASCKQGVIIDNIDKLARTTDKKNLFLEMSINKMLVNGNDEELSFDYWINFSKFRVNSKKEVQQFQLALQKHYENFQKLYTKSKENVSEIVEALEEDVKLNKLKIASLKDTIKAIDATDNFMVAMNSFQDTNNDNLKKVAREFFLLCLNTKGALEQHRKFFLSPHDFLASNTNIDILAEYYAKIEIHVENIEKFFEVAIPNQNN